MEELISEFRVIERFTKSSGTCIIIWNLCTKSSGELEFDFMKDPKDIRILDDEYKNFREPNKRQTQGSKSVTESDYSLRAYCSILYLRPRMEIILQGQKVETPSITTTLAKAREDTYKPECLKKTLRITFGYNKKSMEHYGLMMYNKNRLIKAYVRVPCQRKPDHTGQGVIGVIECDHLKPTHNKQDFDDTQEYRNTMKNLNIKLEQYWRDVNYSHQAFKPVANTESSTDASQATYLRLLPEDSNEEPLGYLKAHKLDEKKKKSEDDKNRQQNLSRDRSSIQTTPSFTLISQSLTDAGSSPSDDTLVDTPRKRRALGQGQDNTEKKKVKKIDFDNIPDPSTSTASPATFSHDSSDNIVGRKNIKTAPKGSDGMSDKRRVKEQCNHITQASSEHQQNYEVQLLQAKEEINQLQLKVNSLEGEKKDLEEIKKGEKVKVSLEDRWTQTDFPISLDVGSAATSAESSNLGGMRDSHFGPQQHQTQDRPECEQGNRDTQIYRLRLRKLRQSVARLLVSFVPALNPQEMNWDSEELDEILTQVINKISSTDAAST